MINMWEKLEVFILTLIKSSEEGVIYDCANWKNVTVARLFYWFCLRNSSILFPRVVTRSWKKNAS